MEKERKKESHNREEGDLVRSRHSSRSLTALAILYFRLLSSSPSLTLLMGDSRGVSIWCQLQIVRRWRAAGTQGCAVFGPHSSQFTHQTPPSTIRPLRKVTLLLNNSLTGCYCWRELNERATFSLAREK